jgi:eukaryotic-like serine/threonine-protein kinase
MTDLLTGRYRIDSRLGAGGMGEVFLGHDVRLERRVAIKWLHPDHEQDLVARERLRREALAALADLRPEYITGTPADRKKTLS